VATLREAVQSLLAGDATLVSTLTGGVYDRREINRTAMPGAYDARGNLEPCAVVALSTQNEIAPHPEYAGFTEEFLFVYYYEQEGNSYAAIDVAMERVRTLLHGQRVTVTLGTVFEIRHADGNSNLYDDALRAEMGYDRFVVWRKR